MFEVTTSDGFGFPSGITQLKCPCGRDTTYVSFIDSTSKDVHRDSQPTERSNTMTTEAPVVTPDQQKIVYLEEQKVALEKRIEALMIDLSTQRSIVDEHRRKVGKLFTKVNDFIEENDCEIEHDISLSELDDILSDVFNNRLVFEKVYEVQVSYTMDVTFEIRAKNEDEAREMADEIGISRDPEFDHDEDPTECVIDTPRIGYVSRKEN
jgi:uncharacterized coiled-coil protein SlyX